MLFRHRFIGLPALVLALGLLSGLPQDVRSAPQAQTAPSLQLPSAQGPIDLQQFRGKVVYLDFWASWCKPCRKSFPFMNALQDKYGPQGLQVIAVNLDRDRKQVDKFLAAYPARFLIAYDPEGEAARRYRVKGMPSSYLIDATGQIRARHIGFRDRDKAGLEAQIKQLILTSPRSH